MRILLFSIIALFLFSIGGCKKLRKKTQFEMEYTNEVVIHSSSPIDLPFNFYTPEVETNSEKTFESKKTKSKLIEEIRLIALEGTLTQPNNGSLNFLKSIHVYLKAGGLPEKLIAWKENIPSTVGKQLVLETINDDLKEYIKKEQYTLRVSTTTNQILTANHHIDIISRFYVDAGILWL